MTSFIKFIILAAFLSFASTSAWAEQSVIYFTAKHTDIPALDSQKLQAVIASHPDAKFVITANTYDANDESIRCMPRKYSLVRALKIRQIMLQKGVQLDNIQVMVTTDTHKENDLVTIDVK